MGDIGDIFLQDNNSQVIATSKINIIFFNFILEVYEVYFVCRCHVDNNSIYCL